MKRFAIAAPIAILAAAFAGCTTPGPNSPASTSMAPVAQPVAYWTGTGVVQSVKPCTRTSQRRSERRGFDRRRPQSVGTQPGRHHLGQRALPPGHPHG